MKQVAIFLLTGLVWCQPVSAQEPTATVTDPVAERARAIWTTTKTVADVLGPGYDQLYDFKSGEWFQVVSASLWNFTSKEYQLASLRIGYGVDYKILSGVQLDLPGITHRYVPATIRGIVTKGYLDTVWAVAGKYGRVGFLGGYDFDTDEPAVGVTVGAVLTF